MPRVRRMTARSRPHAAQRSSENQYGRINAHARGRVRRRLMRWGGGSWRGLATKGTRLKPSVARSIVRCHDVILQDSAPTAAIARRAGSISWETCDIPIVAADPATEADDAYALRSPPGPSAHGR